MGLPRRLILLSNGVEHRAQPTYRALRYQSQDSSEVEEADT